jgi:predicted esterase
MNWNDPALTLPTADQVKLLVASGNKQAPALPEVSAQPGPPVSPKPGTASYFLHVPSNPAPGPLWVLVALHGFGEKGPEFSHFWTDLAEANNWILVAPTFVYTDLNNAIDTRTDDVRFTAELSEILRDVPRRTGLQTHDRALLVGFSRGGSAVERFSLIHPDQVQAVAALSGGAYTLPQACVEKNGKSAVLPLPLGTADIATWTDHPFDAADFKRIPFFLSVGGDDNKPQFLPSTYDVMIGQSRLERGQTLDRALLGFGLPTVKFTVYPGVAHMVTPDMVHDAGAFLVQQSSTIR